MAIAHNDWIEQFIDVFYLKLVDLQLYEYFSHFDCLTPFIDPLFGAHFLKSNAIFKWYYVLFDF